MRVLLCMSVVVATQTSYELYSTYTHLDMECYKWEGLFAITNAQSTKLWELQSDY